MKKANLAKAVALKIKDTELNLENTLVNGQCFNWRKIDTDHFAGIWRNGFGTWTRISADLVEMKSAPEMPSQIVSDEFLGNYFRFPAVKVEDLYQEWTKMDPVYFGKVGKHLPGVRCLRQDPLECLICFIISSNNNIKRIT